MTTCEKTLIITNKLGLHARAATKLAQLCQKFDASVTVSLDDNSADASSIMGLMLLAGSQGKSVTVVTQGADAEAAIESVCQLFSDKFDEEE
ncbi:HPr family phosphocarrier protein [Pseudocolwellia sp. AS88]|jgi:phosphotransferase system HPr (HPr) family protein|uniref:HPr family phosphocarrier protein n=1 Tax=Pseudocolwellia TaxID=2848177 RepID=UPI0026EE8E67|nr:HPr family phosphocarrier protein [Pseudocolwellia sp. AS88]MDO7086170.1 HPr family phosphocarrier protein [Pseudocolwellia sp. AS88]